MSDTPDTSLAEPDEPEPRCGAETTAGRPCRRRAGEGRPTDTGPCWEHVGESRAAQASEMARFIAHCLREKLPLFGDASLTRFGRQAGAATESDTDRSGFLSYHAETHALGVGLAAGFYYGATGDKRLMAAIVGIALAAERGATALDPKIVDDIRSEPHYALVGVIPGYVLGFFSSHGYFPDQFPIPFADWLIRWLVVNGWLLLG